MKRDSMHWMKYSIDISKSVSSSYLHVGAVLVSDQNELLCSAYTCEERDKLWYDVILTKVQKLNVSCAQSLYITINTLSADAKFDVLALLTIVSIKELYIGLPDPALTKYFDDDPVTSFQNVYRYPDELQREILGVNENFFTNSQQCIKRSPYYSENRISNLVIDKLQSKGLDVSKTELDLNKRKFELANLIHIKYGIEYEEANSIVSNVLAEAFNSKYSTYTYSYDTRSLDSDWKNRFMSFYKELSAIPLSNLNILNVGVGGGQEAIDLFLDCYNITFVDIAQGGLERIKEQIPLSKTLVASADNLFSIPNHTYDLYVSLRTYNSSFFDIKEAIKEANRVLKTHAMIIISVANGFLYPKHNCIIPGLIIPGTEFVDIYRSMETTKVIKDELIRAGFHDVQIFSTNTEIYLSAING